MQNPLHGVGSRHLPQAPERPLPLLMAGCWAGVAASLTVTLVVAGTGMAARARLTDQPEPCSGRELGPVCPV